MILDTCGTSATIPRLPLNANPPFGLSQEETLTLGEVPISSAGGQYRLCWCARGFSCSLASEFAVDAGEVLIIGPSELTQDRTCVSGQTCSIDGIVGMHLSSGDSYVVLDTCATGAAVPRFPFFQLQNYSHVYDWASTVVTAAGQRFTWGSTAVTAAGGLYRLCWCAMGYTCSIGGDYHVDLGALNVVGPSPLFQDRTCVSGQTCFLDDLTGDMLSNADSIMISDTCGVDHVVPRFQHAGFGVDTSPWIHTSTALLMNVSTKGISASWGTLAISAAGGEYRLCWCASSQNPCSTFAAFRTDMGELKVVGMSPLSQGRTCVSGQTCE
jgi:hypothetical protein